MSLFRVALILGILSSMSVQAQTPSPEYIPPPSTSKTLTAISDNAVFTQMQVLTHNQLAHPFIKAEAPSRPKQKKPRNVNRYRAETQMRVEPCREDARVCAQNQLIARRAKACDARKQGYDECLRKATELSPTEAKPASPDAKPASEAAPAPQPAKQEPTPKPSEPFKGGLGPVNTF